MHDSRFIGNLKVITAIFFVFGFAVPIAVHLQNINGKFHKVV